MVDFVIPNTFSPNTPAKSADVNANFDALETYVNALTATMLASGPRVLRRAELSDPSPFSVQDPTLTNVGLAVTFTMPTLTGQQLLRISLGVPQTEVAASGGGWPQNNSRFGLRVRETSTSATRLYGQIIVGSTGPYDPFAQDSMYVERTYTQAASPWPVGSSVTLHVYGMLEGAVNTQGKIRLTADSGSLKPFLQASVI